jgi:hypothetical protein
MIRVVTYNSHIQRMGEILVNPLRPAGKAGLAPFMIFFLVFAGFSSRTPELMNPTASLDVYCITTILSRRWRGLKKLASQGSFEAR